MCSRPNSSILTVPVFWWDCSSAHHHCKAILVGWHFPFLYESSHSQGPLEKIPNSPDPNVLKNIMPVSNLPFASKLSEKIVLDHLLCHLDQNNLWHSFQSAYRPKHSSETGLLCVFNDLMPTSDSGFTSILTLTDLSTAFNTIVHIH